MGRKGCNRLYLSVRTTLSENIMSNVCVAGVASKRAGYEGTQLIKIK